MPKVTGITKDKITITLDSDIVKWLDKLIKKRKAPSRSYIINESVKEAKKEMDKK